MTIVLEEDSVPAAEMREQVRAGLRAYNLSQVPDTGPSGTFAVYARDPETGTVTGGLWANYGFYWMFIELLSVPRGARGQGFGRMMMMKAEARARALGLTGIWLDTFTFQARGFYEKLGFSVFGTLNENPIGHSRIFLCKYLKPAHPSE